MRVLLTGPNGFIGKPLAIALEKAGHTVVLHAHSQGDISQCKLDYENIDHVIHLASKAFVPESWTHTHEYYMINVMGTVNVLEFCRRTKASLTFLSTYVYGSPTTLPVTEDHALNPASPYNHSKLMAEDACAFYHRIFDVRVNILRPFNIYGEGQPEKFVIPKVLKQALDSSSSFIEVENVGPKRDYLHVSDVISAILKTLTPAKPFAIYNVGFGKSYSVADVIELATGITGNKKEIRVTGVIRPNEVMDTVADISKIKKDLGWAPQIDLKTGLKQIVASMT